MSERRFDLIAHFRFTSIRRHLGLGSRQRDPGWGVHPEGDLMFPLFGRVGGAEVESTVPTVDAEESKFLTVTERRNFCRDYIIKYFTNLFPFRLPVQIFIA